MLGLLFVMSRFVVYDCIRTVSRATATVMAKKRINLIWNEKKFAIQLLFHFFVVPLHSQSFVIHHLAQMAE